MTRDLEQDTADLRRHVRRLVESATAEQLEAMREAWGSAGLGFMAEVTGLMGHALALAFEDDALARAADPLAVAEGGEPQRYGYCDAPGAGYSSTHVLLDAPGGPIRIDRTVNAEGTIMTERIEPIIIPPIGEVDPA